MKKCLTKVQYDWNCGRHSGFSICCILWYLGPWQLIIFKIPMMWKWYWTLGNDCDYVRCPICLLMNHQRKMIECNCGNEENAKEQNN
jgi:hypothetical protein